MSHLEAIADEQLMVLIQGDEGRAACDVLIRRYKERAFRFALHLTGNREEALDASQEAFVKVFTRAGQFEPGRRFKPWFMAIVRNTVRSMQRAPWRRRRVCVDELVGQIADRSNDPASSARAAELWRMVLELPPKLREVLVLRHVEGMSYRQIAEVLGVPANTVATRLHAARKQLGARYEV